MLGAEIEALVRRLAAVPARLAAAFARFEGADAVMHVPAGEWTPPEVLAHLRATHDILEPRIFAMLARDNPPLPAYDEARWQAAARYLSLPVTESLETLRWRRRELVHALRGLAPADWARPGVHEVSGPLTVLDLARAIADHDEEHCIQLERQF